MSEAPFLIRNAFHPAMIQAQARRLKAAWGGFRAQEFEDQILPFLAPLGFKERGNLVLAGLLEFMPPYFPDAQQVLLKALPPKLEGTESIGYDGFICWPLGEFVAVRGLDFFEESMEVLYHLTQCFSAEAAIRPFLVRHQQKTLDRLKTWALDPNPHVRRLVSEGTRPRLPWAPALPQFKKDPTPVFPLLERLKNDPELYVRRSVANHLNDVTKDNPALALGLLESWGKKKSREIGWITRHALRSLAKKGDPRALSLLGFETKPEVVIEGFEIRPLRVKVGERLNFSCQLISKAQRKQHLMIDFVVHFQKADASLRAKVFKLTAKTLAPGARLEVSKSMVMKPLSTRRLYLGLHRLSIQVGGSVIKTLDFWIEA
ncbi:MAG: hypothetical protein A2600_01735 [Candidatus Lambdaproteobacteria bacterium RIFOXYD1_FULL_56_27]|uniref:DNA alkylation repair protein n=1 Tax=Candidatus Lambdaproteobacteria bacterium RIFOXYD2_FULL_56_26 TaxID=1817773 RepID=A0A1F6GMX0_9PROT|nr:MAG: hypothetical protein A2557_12695 [Candidatus Lambdaproteobacteria bacterium RIFOXYD2_FULL_56_26]OGH05566.1 MAG: hypothetical protein A2426_04525 [Candidatus Lambdaproteobacteria bacterium RIFOXYC1_FULL_56_13]OGH08525.1 MAG: hypothetical protein A2600_01735 [Candidatus Lambdaproteobacteria bacterium RIFOXYD1_FULL_56_27]